MATLQGKAVKNTYRQILQIGANNVGVSGSLQPVQDGAGVNTALSLSTAAATINGDLTITGDLIITGGGIQITDLIDDTVASLIQNGTGITWTYNDAARTLTGNFTGTTTVVPEGTNLYYTQGRFDSAFAAKSTTNLAEGTNLYFTEARGNANFATNFATKTTTNLPEGTNLYFTNARARTALSVTAGTGLSYDNTTGVFNLDAIPNASLTNSSITINGQAVALGGTVTLTTTNIGEGTNLYWTEARGNANFATNLAASTTTNLAEGTNLYYTQARFNTAFGNKSTTDLSEGTNLYYTQARFNSALAAKTTTDLAEGTNLYYTDSRARLALSSSATGLSYANNSGVFSLTAGYAIPTTVKLGEYDIAYNRSIVSAAVTGTTTKTLSLTQQDANVVTATWTDLGITTINGTANQIAATTVANTTTLAFTNDVTFPNNVVVSGNLTINGTATYVNTESISSKDPLFEVANTNNSTDAVDIGYYGRYYDAIQERVEFTGLFRDASDAGKFKIFSGLVDEPTNVVNTTGTGYTVATLVANVDGSLNGTANAANQLSTARTIAASGDATWSVNFDGTANVTSALTLANTGVTATTYGTSTAVPTIAIDSKGRITSASNTNITFPVTTVNGFAGTVVLTTTDVAEGTNQYFTTARAQAAITGGASSVVTADLTASRALVSDGSGKIAASATTTTTEIGYLAGVTSALQTQLDGKLNLTGGTLTGGLIGTTGSFSSSGSGNTFTIGHTSGSGIALNITKDGNGEGLYINKASGSGNAATIVGTLNATTLVKNGGTASQFLKADGSVDSNTYATTSALAGYLPLAGGTLTGALNGTSATFSNAVNSDGRFGATTNQISPSDGSAYFYKSSAGAVVSGFQFIAETGGAGSRGTRLTIDNTGAATFSNSVTAAGVTIGDSDIRSSSNVLTLGGTSEVVRITGGNVGIGTSSPGSFVEMSKSSNSGSGGTFPRLAVKNTLATQGDGSSTFNFADILISSGNEAVNMFLATTYAAGTWAPAAIINVSTNHDLQIKTNNTERMRITSGGSVYVNGTTSAIWVSSSASISQVTINESGFPLVVAKNDNLCTILNRTNSNGGILEFKYNGSTVGSISTNSNSLPSDLNFKKDITDLSLGLNLVSKLRPVHYRHKMDNDDEALSNGIIAQELEKALLDCGVQKNSLLMLQHKPNEKQNESQYWVDYTKMIPVLIKSIQEQQAQIEAQDAKIEELKALIAAK